MKKKKKKQKNNRFAKELDRQQISQTRFNRKDQIKNRFIASKQVQFRSCVTDVAASQYYDCSGIKAQVQ